MLRNSLHHRARVSVIDLETFCDQFGGEFAHGGDDEMRALNVPLARCNFSR